MIVVVTEASLSWLGWKRGLDSVQRPSYKNLESWQSSVSTGTRETSLRWAPRRKKRYGPGDFFLPGTFRRLVMGANIPAAPPQRAESSASPEDWIHFLTSSWPRNIHIGAYQKYHGKRVKPSPKRSKSWQCEAAFIRDSRQGEWVQLRDIWCRTSPRPESGLIRVQRSESHYNIVESATKRTWDLHDK